jgi:UDP-N-acetylglucosamine 2-epimerase (non-hydrolysing)
MAALPHEVKKRPHFFPILIHTGQHYSPEMSDGFFEELGLPEPDYNLGVHGGSQTVQTAEIMRALEPVLAEAGCELVLTVGDVNSTLAAALVAAKAGIRVAHVEAGLRSFDRGMPEEINRLVTDAISDYLFASEPSGVENLRREGVPEGKVWLVGNVMIDTLLRCRGLAARSTVVSLLGLQPKGYALATLHRPSNVDDAGKLGEWLRMMDELAAAVPVVFPIHPRTRQRIESFGLATGRIQLAAPLPYLDFLQLMSEAKMVLTDSGGIQEETTILQVPCLTLRDNTERPVTIERGSNRLVGTDPEKVLRIARETLAAPAGAGQTPDLWDGSAAARIFDVLERQLMAARAAASGRG